MTKLHKHTLKLLAGSTLVSLLAFSTTPYAQSYQRFAGINYSNPAALNIVKQFQMIVGGSDILYNAQFTGNYGATPGSITSRTQNFLPYGRLAARLSPSIVIGLDITQPLFLDFSYPSPSFIDQATIDTRLRSVDYSPRVSWQVNEKLAVGAGLNINNIYEALFAFRAAPFGTLTIRGDSWGLGWNVGALYTPRLGTYLGLSYFSKIINHVGGKSTWGAFSNNYTKASILSPATLSGTVTQFVQKNWLFNLTLNYTFWDPLRYLNIQNTAIPGAGKTITLPEFFYNNLAYTLGTKYDFNDSWSGLAFAGVNPNVQPLAYRGLGFITSTAYIFGFGGEYTIQGGLKAKFVYGHSTARPQINRQYPTGLALGRANLVGNSYDFSIVYDV